MGLKVWDLEFTQDMVVSLEEHPQDLSDDLPGRLVPGDRRILQQFVATPTHQAGQDKWKRIKSSDHNINHLSKNSI